MNSRNGIIVDHRVNIPGLSDPCKLFEHMFYIKLIESCGFRFDYWGQGENVGCVGELP